MSPLIDPNKLAPTLQNPSTGVRVIDCRHDLSQPSLGESLWRSSRIPGAVHLHLEKDLSSPPSPGSGRHPFPNPQQLVQTLAQKGVGADADLIVAYDDSGGLFAARCIVVLRWLGISNALLLNGGLKSFPDPLDSNPPENPKPAPPFPIRLDDSFLVSEQHVAQRPDNVLLLDARTPDRFSGQHEPLDRAAGHIPGAQNHPWNSNLNPKTSQLLPPKTLQSLFLKHNPSYSSNSVHYCGSGVSACFNILAAQAASLPPGQLYVPSWSGWIDNPLNLPSSKS